MRMKRAVVLFLPHRPRFWRYGVEDSGDPFARQNVTIQAGCEMVNCVHGSEA